MSLNGMHDVIPTQRYSAEGMRVPRFAIHSQVGLVELMDDLTGNVIAQYDSSGVAVASEPDIESATPNRRDGILKPFRIFPYFKSTIAV